MRRAGAAGLVIALAALTAGCLGGSGGKAGGGGRKHVVVLSLAQPDSGDYDIGEFVQEVDRLSRGSIRIDIRDRWRSDEPGAAIDRRTIEDVRRGRVDLAKLEARSWHRLGVHSLDALVAPFLIDTYSLEQRVLQSDLPRGMFARLRKTGVVGVAVLPGQLRRSVGISRRFVRVSDFAGRTVWTPPSPVAAATYRALGARLYRPEPIEEYDEYAEGFDRSHGDRGARAMTVNLVFWPRPLTIVANPETFARLSPEQRAVLVEAGRRAVAPAVERLRALDAEALQNVCDRGFSLVTSTRAERNAFREAVRSVYAVLQADPNAKGYLHKIEAMKARSPGRTSPAPTCRAGQTKTGRGGQVPAALIGVWRTSFTAAEFRAAPLVPGETAPPGNTVTLTLRASGRFDFAGTVGDYVVRGDRINFKVEGTVEEGGGETWRLRWSIYRGVLAFARIGPGPSPTPFVIKPWRRVG